MTQKFLYVLLTAVCSGILCFYYGWRVRGWQDDEMYERARAELFEKALSERIKAERTVNDAALAAGVIAGQASQKMEKVKDDLKELPALHAACRPDDSRAGRLHGAINVANSAISTASGYHSGKAVRAAAVP